MTTPVQDAIWAAVDQGIEAECFPPFQVFLDLAGHQRLFREPWPL